VRRLATGVASNQAAAVRPLGLDRKTLYRKLTQYKIRAH
jgi:DNA-binding protein Fis